MREPPVRVTVTGNTIRDDEKAGLVFGGHGPGRAAEPARPLRGLDDRDGHERG